MVIERQPVGIMFVGSKPLFDAGATLALHELRIEHEFVGGTGFGAIAAAFFASGQSDLLVDKAVELANDQNQSGIKWLGRFRSKFVLEKHLDLVKMRSSKAPIIIGMMNYQFFRIDPIVLNKISDNEAVFSVLRANNTIPMHNSTDRFACDGGVIDVHPVMSSYVKAGVTRLILITSALPETTPGTVYSQFILNARYNELIKSLCLCQALSPYLQVYMVAPTQPLLTGIGVPTSMFDKKRRELEIKQGYDLTKQVLGKFSTNTPDPKFTGWAAVLGLQALADRCVRSTGLELYLNPPEQG